MDTAYRRPLLLLTALASASFLVACGAEPPEGVPTVVVTETVTAESEPTTAEETIVAEPEPEGASCEPTAFADDAPITVMYCDGEWAYVGVSQTGHVWVTQNVGGEWAGYEGDGETHSGMSRPCYLPDRLAADGVPQEIVDKLATCDSDDEIY